MSVLKTCISILKTCFHSSCNLFGVRASEAVSVLTPRIISLIIKRILNPLVPNYENDLLLKVASCSLFAY